MSDEAVTVRLLFVDEGYYHHEEITVPAHALERYERLIDLLQEEPELLRRTYVDLSRLCTAHVVEE
jgi:hypothetical protein